MKANIANDFNCTVLDDLLVKADDGGIKVIKVKKKGSRDFDTMIAAVDSIPLENMEKGGGEYFCDVLW
ncbi:hypothetical protein REPUB_Repub03eG0053600 [Reevesia pubescens]